MRIWKLWIWPGLTATACLTALAVWFEAANVESDLTSRAGAALSTSQGWAQVSVRGRDLTLSGLAPDEGSRIEAADIARSIFGVRTVENVSQLLPVQDPYRLTIEKTVDGVSLRGFAPNARIRAAILSRLAGMLPGLAVSDRIELARGAPEGLVDLAGFGLLALPRLRTGVVEITGTALRVSGQALNSEDHEALLSALSGPPPADGRLESVDITPAMASGDYSWSAVRGEDGIGLSGYVPDPATRGAVVEAAKAVAPNMNVEDRMRFASGIPSNVDWRVASAQALALMGDLSTGMVSINGNVLSVSGQAVDADAFRRLQTALASDLEGGLTPGTSDIGVAPVSPFEWTARIGADGLAISGYVPGEAVRASLLDAARLKFGALAEADAGEIAAGAPSGFDEAALVLLQALSLMVEGDARIVDGSVSLRGAAYSARAEEEIGRLLRLDLPEGFTSQKQVSVIRVPETVMSESDCQAELDRLAQTNRVLFDTGKAAIQVHSHGFLDRIAFATRQCGSAQLEISGHTDSDGAEEANLTLSERRARAVVEFMTAAGVPAERLVATGYGESRPVMSNDTEAGKAANRRIEFRVVN